MSVATRDRHSGRLQREATTTVAFKWRIENGARCKDGTLVECSVHVLRGSRIRFLLVIDKVQSWINTNVAYKRFKSRVFVVCVCVFTRLMLRHKAGISSWWYKT